MRFVWCLTIIVLIVLTLVLAGCESPAAQRELAEASRIRAETDDYVRKTAADMAAVAERANIRQMERDAAHQRTLETLPFVMIVAGLTVVVLVLIGTGVLIWREQSIRRSTPGQELARRESVESFEEFRRFLNERDRMMWQALAQAVRERDQARAGPAQHGGPVHESIMISDGGPNSGHYRRGDESASGMEDG